MPRALAFEHRFVAAVADPGVVDVSTSWLQPLRGLMRSQLRDPSKRDAFDTEMGWTERFSRSTRATLHFRGEPYGVRFTAAEGANRHCEPMGLAVRDTRLFDWLDRYLAA